MSIYIYKYLEYVPWDVVGVGVVQHKGGTALAVPPCDLSNYYTKNQLSSYHSSQVHWTNIIWDGKLGSLNCFGQSIVVGTLVDTATRLARGSITGTSTVTGTGWTYCEFLKGTINGVSSTAGSIHPIYGEGTTYIFRYSIEDDSSANVNLVGDVASPGNSKLYGTNSSGVRGWYDIPTAGVPDAHNDTHENGGSDEISVAGLSGVLADAQTPATHYHDSDYVSIVGSPTEGNFPTLTAGGEIQNSSYNASSFLYITWGSKYSSSDAGTVGQRSIDDDYLYICVATGGAGAATWKKIALTQSP
jgi:hypothetical protein